MQFTVKDLAKIFKTTERTVAGWVRKGELKAQRDGESYLFNRDDVLEWAMMKKLQVPDELLDNSESYDNQNNLLSASIKSGGIFYGVKGKNKAEVLKNVIGLLRLPPSADRDYLLKMVLAREKLSSTAIGDGIAIPHLRSPIVIKIERPQTALCFTENPVDFDAIDGLPVTILFMILSPNVKSHLKILSRISYFLRDEKVKQFLKSVPPESEILRVVQEFETSLVANKNS
jgi:PTS system nitrogen regulatory IIA component